MSTVARRVAAVFLLLTVSATLSPDEARAQDVWALLKQPEHVVLMRHANAPGVGEDPPGIDLKNCKLQRNLDEAGRNQARAVGDAFRQHGITSARLISSRFCRALETARLLRLGPVQELAALNYVNFEDPQLDTIIAKTNQALKATAPRQLAVAVTHVSNVKALTSVTPASAEMVVVKFDAAGKLAVVGRIPPPAAK